MCAVPPSRRLGRAPGDEVMDIFARPAVGNPFAPRDFGDRTDALVAFDGPPLALGRGVGAFAGFVGKQRRSDTMLLRFRTYSSTN